jgi:hypothetical protein
MFPYLSMAIHACLAALLPNCCQASKEMIMTWHGLSTSRVGVSAETSSSSRPKPGRANLAQHRPNARLASGGQGLGS